MLKLEKTEVVGWEAAIRGMRNPMNSWEQSDSFCKPSTENCCGCHDYNKCAYIFESTGKPYRGDIGTNDLDLMTRLCSAGTDHRKFMRMIEVYVDITAPLYWWKEFDTYKVGTVANSCSTMHKIAAKEFTLEDFSHEHLMDNAMADVFQVKSPLDILYSTIDMLNLNRKLYLETKDKKYWWQMIQLLPTSYNQKRTIMLSYEVLANIYKSRRHHKLDEWHTLCDWIEDLPHSEMITGGAEYLNKKLTIPATDEIIACVLSKLQTSGGSPDKSKAILMEFYEKMRKSDIATPPNNFKIIDEWNQYGHVNCVESKALRDHFNKLAEEGKR